MATLRPCLKKKQKQTKITAPLLVSGGYRKNNGELSLLLNHKPSPGQKAPIYYAITDLIILFHWYEPGM